MYKFEFNKREVDFIIENAGLTEDEEAVFYLRRRGKTVVAIALELNMSTSSVDRRIRNIKKKIKRII